MIQKISNPGQSATNSVVVINNTACCGAECVECAYVVDGIIIGDLISEPATYTFLNSVGVSVSVTLTTADIGTIRNELLVFINSIGYYGTLDDIQITEYINEFDFPAIKIEIIGCAVFVSLDYPPDTVLAEKLCNFSPVCDYYFESDGNGGDPVSVSENGNAGTVHKFDILTDGAEDVVEFLKDFFTISTITVVANTDAGYFEVTLTGAPNDLLYIDGVQGIKSNCRKVYTA